MRLVTPEHVSSLAPNEIFVFGSNLAGRHGRGAALTARRMFGAKYGVGAGPTGQCYAIPTKDRDLRVLPVPVIRTYVDDFLEYATAHRGLRFLVTEIGCGLAGYHPKQIAPLFLYAPDNVLLPLAFIRVLGGGARV